MERSSARSSDPVAADARLRRRIVWLMGARLVLSTAIFAVALALEGVARGGVSRVSENGLFGTLALAFFVTAISGLIHRHVRYSGRFVAAQLATDIAIVTSLVYFSGGRDSIFSFLYVLVPVYGAVVFDQRGAFGAAFLAAAAYGFTLLAGEVGWIHDHSSSPGGSAAMLFAQWGVHAGAMLLVALLAALLSRELERADRELVRSASDLHRLRNLHGRTVESLKSGLLTTDLAGRVTSFNQEAERMTGVAIGEVLDREIEAVLPGAREQVIDPVREGREGKPRERMRYRNGRGEEIFLGLAGSVLRDEEGLPAGYVVIFQDVTRVVQMETELRRSERLAAVGQLAADIAHEIRNPLAAISGSIQILAGSSKPGGEPDRLMGIALRETDRLNRLISNFLEYARPAAPSPARVEVGTVIAEIGKMLSATDSQQLRLEIRIEPGLVAWVDEGQLRQLLWNLCLNAHQAMPDGGNLLVSTSISIPELPQEVPTVGRKDALKESGPQVEICVADSGVGIPPDSLDRIFDPFFTTKAEGTGLGLSTVHRIVEENAGTLHVESSPGVGTTFRIRLPIAKEIA